jgi:uncharacterized protein involved in type VI secretion and phage assembly
MKDGNEVTSAGAQSGAVDAHGKRRFYGKYRGIVVSNADPKQLGRLQVSCPQFGAVPLSWAMPCVPFAGPLMGFAALPIPGSGVWIEFEQGDIDYPIWVGCFWGEGELPPAAHAVPPETPGIVLQTPTISLVLSDTAGLLVQSVSGANLSINPAGVVALTGSASVLVNGPTVNVNGPALVVTAA